MSPQSKESLPMETLATPEDHSKEDLDNHDLEVGKEKKESGSVNGEPEYPSGYKVFLICVSLLSANFLVALDQTIVAAAVPAIANEFDALSDVGWYASGYLLTGVATQPIFGKAFQFFSKRWLFFGSITVFEVGSIICACSHSSKVFIVGRAIAGVGFGGLYIGVISITSDILPVAKQAPFFSLIGACYGLGATIGPVIGGTFTSKVTWRWCFWLNLPIGGLSLAINVLFMHPPKHHQPLSVKKRLLSMDWAGTVILLGSVICLLMALQDGGVTTPWDSPKSKGLIVGFGLLLLLFFVIQYFMKENASIVLRVARDRNISLLAICNFMIGGVYFCLLYYIPIYFQAVRGSSSIHSGVQALAFIGCAIVSVIFVGLVIEKSGGVFNPSMLICVAMGSIGAGLLYTMGPHTSIGKWVGYSILAGLEGGAFMVPYVGSQICLPAEDRGAGATTVVFAQTLGATVLVSVANAIYQNKLLQGIKKVPGVDVAAVVGSGVSSFRQIVSADLLPAVVQVAADSVGKVFLGLAVIAAICFFFALGVQWKNLKGESKDGDIILAPGGA